MIEGSRIPDLECLREIPSRRHVAHISLNEPAIYMQDQPAEERLSWLVDMELTGQLLPLQLSERAWSTITVSEEVIV
jgi:hypothetical protein